MAVEHLTATGAGTTDAVVQNGYAKNLKYVATTIEVTAAASVSSTYKIARVPSGARLAGSGRLYWDDMATSGAPTLDIGVSGESFTLDDDIINDGLDLATANVIGIPIIKDKANYGKPLYELAGLSSDPGEIWTIQGEIKDAAVIAGGTLTAEIIYSTD